MPGFPYDLKDRLVAQGVGIYGTDIFVGSRIVIPTGDGPYIVITETGGIGSAKTQNDTATERPGAQISCRAAKMSVARGALLAAYTALGGRNGLYNLTLSGTQYLSVVAQQGLTDLGPDETGKRVRMVFNVLCEKGPDSYVPPSTDPGVIEELGGDAFSFSRPSAPDAYPAGATYDKIVPGSWLILLDGGDLTAGTFVLEVSARVDVAVGGRAKVGLFRMDLPNNVLSGSEIEFTADELVGERKQSAGSITIADGDHTYGIKMTTDNIAVASAVWGARLKRI